MVMIHLGFTGTRWGMTVEQEATVRMLIRQLTDEHGRITVHHGACVGADSQFHFICMNMGVEIAQVHQHLPRDPKWKANLQGGIFEYPLDYADRNQAIVNASHYVIGAPYEAQPQIRGGTWQTVRFAQDRGNLWRVVLPSGVAVKG